MAVEKVVIIGSGPAAWTAAIYAARAALEPLVYEGAMTEENRQQGTTPLGQLNLTTEVENFPSWPTGDTREYLKTALGDKAPYWVTKNKPQPTHGIQGPEMMELMRQQALNFGTRVVTDDIVKLELDKHPFVLHTLEGQRIETHTVILATGARANYLGLPSEHNYKNKGVSACAVCEGSLPPFRNKPLVVVGGGDSAIEEATYLTKFASRVYLLVRRDALRASQIMQKRLFDTPKILPIFNTSISEVKGNDNWIESVKLVGESKVRKPDGSWQMLGDYLGENPDPNFIDGEIAVAGMFCAIGHTPNTPFLDGQLKLNEKGYIEWTTVARTYTSIDGVFAAGDVSDDYYRQAISASGTGCMAALDAERWLGHHGLV